MPHVQTHNQTITPASTLVVLVDCEPEEKGDGVATWAGSTAGAEKVRIFSERDREEMHRKMGKGRFFKLALLISAIQKGDKAKIAECQTELSGIIDSDNASIDIRDLNRDHKQYEEWLRLMAHLGVKPDRTRWYGRRDRMRKLYNFFGTNIFRVFGSEQAVYLPPSLGKRGSEERERRKNYHRQFRARLRSQERKLEEILAGERLAPALESEINLSHWQISKLLSRARLVCWHHKKSFQPALYCGQDLRAAYYAYIFTKGFVSVSSNQVLCSFCGKPFIKMGKKTYCSPAHRAAAAQRRYRANLKKKKNA